MVNRLRCRRCWTTDLRDAHRSHWSAHRRPGPRSRLPSPSWCSGQPQRRLRQLQQGRRRLRQATPLQRQRPPCRQLLPGKRRTAAGFAHGTPVYGTIVLSLRLCRRASCRSARPHGLRLWRVPGSARRGWGLGAAWWSTTQLRRRRSTLPSWTRCCTRRFRGWTGPPRLRMFGSSLPPPPRPRRVWQKGAVRSFGPVVRVARGPVSGAWRGQPPPPQGPPPRLSFRELPAALSTTWLTSEWERPSLLFGTTWRKCGHGCEAAARGQRVALRRRAPLLHRACCPRQGARAVPAHSPRGAPYPTPFLRRSGLASRQRASLTPSPTLASLSPTTPTS
mmetsp:Transcript_26529/g.99810  ORF Transcript_26529/g.99810 Transcript_26529/m.99810 type:complete len:334 (-) Transcript_26529:2520-3521(-)